MAHADDEGAPLPYVGPEALGFGRLFDQIRDAVVVARADGRIMLWNRAAVHMFGYRMEEAVGRDVSMIVPERLKARHAAGMKRFRETGTGPYISRGTLLELPALRKDGTEIVVEMTLSRIDAPEPLTVAILRDVTARVRLQAEMEEERRRLRDANETLESFTYVVGHDLKEPVRAVDVYLDAVAEHVSGQEAREALKKAQLANRRMASLLEGLLDWSRAVLSGLDLVPVNVPDVIRSSACTSRYQSVIEERGAALSVSGEFHPVLGTEGLLCQMFGNLILNALRHNPRPDPRIDVVGLGAEGGLLRVAVRDNGPGFSPEVRRRISTMRATRPSTVRGGFGMTIATRAAHTLGGRLDFGATPEGGAEVVVSLPLAPR